VGYYHHEANLLLQLGVCQRQTPTQFSKAELRGNRQQATGNRQQATGNRQQATGNYTHLLNNRVNYLLADNFNQFISHFSLAFCIKARNITINLRSKQ